MSWKPRDIVGEAMNIYLSAFTGGGEEDVIWSRPATEFQPTSKGTKISHDAAMINKVERLRPDNELLKPVTVLLQELPEKQYHAIIAKHLLVGLNLATANPQWQDGKAWTDIERAAKVAQGYDQYRQNVSRATSKIYEKMKKVLEQCHNI